MNEGNRRCCGMDIHKDTVVVCVLPPVGGDGQAVRKTYGTFRNDLIRMRMRGGLASICRTDDWMQALCRVPKSGSYG